MKDADPMGVSISTDMRMEHFDGKIRPILFPYLFLSDELKKKESDLGRRLYVSLEK